MIHLGQHSTGEKLTGIPPYLEQAYLDHITREADRVEGLLWAGEGI